MAVFKEADFQRLVREPDPNLLAILVYGPDAGLVSERYQSLIEAYSTGNDDPFGTTVLDAADLDRDPERLVNEGLTVSMFAGNRIVGVKGSGSKSIDKQVGAVLDLATAGTTFVIAMGDLKKSQSLRKRIESSDQAAALPCYVDAARDIERIINEETDRAGLTISADARELLRSTLGANRLASRGELEKLCLYCAGKERIETDDVEEIVGDAAAFALDTLIDAALGGYPERVELEYDRLTGSGMHPSAIATQALRHVQNLDLAVADRELGRSAEDALSRIRPPVFFKRKDAVRRQIGLWTGARIGRAANVLYEAIDNGRRHAALEPAIISEALLSISRVAQSLGRRS
ncbi:MAG: DNA polymerase III subunit delta [Pseudomonadota bacterium]